MAICRVGWRSILTASLVFWLGACDAPEGLGALRPTAPTVTPGGAIAVGITAGGVARARISIEDAEIAAAGYPGLPYRLLNGGVGVRGYVKEGSNAPLRRPADRYSNQQGFILLGGLAGGKLYNVTLVGVSNLGFETKPGTSEWDHDGDDNTPAVPLAIATPDAKSDADPPAPPGAPTVVWQGNAVGVSWAQGSAEDLWGYIVERAVAEGAFAAITGTLPDAAQPQISDRAVESGTAYSYRVIAEDLSGNQSVPSEASTDITVP